MFDYVMENESRNDLLMFNFFLSLLEEWESNLTDKKVEGGWNWKKIKFHKLSQIR